MHIIRCLVLPLLALVVAEAGSFRAVALRAQVGVARGRWPSACDSGASEAAQQKIISFSERALAQVRSHLLETHLSGVAHKKRERLTRSSPVSSLVSVSLTFLKPTSRVLHTKSVSVSLVSSPVSSLVSLSLTPSAAQRHAQLAG